MVGELLAVEQAVRDPEHLQPCPAPFPLTMGSPSYTLRYHFNDRARKRFTAEISWCI